MDSQAKMLDNIVGNLEKLIHGGAIINEGEVVGNFIEWSPIIFATGIPKIDAQHKRLFDIINKLDRSIKAGAAKPELKRVLDELGYYIKFHFGDEEAHQQRYNFPGYLDHKTLHEKLPGPVTDYYTDFMARKLTDPNYLLTFLS